MSTTDKVFFDNMKKNLGNAYASLIVKKQRKLKETQVYHVFRGECKDTELVNRVLDAAEKVLQDQKALNEKKERLSRITN